MLQIDSLSDDQFVLFSSIIYLNTTILNSFPIDFSPFNNIINKNEIENNPLFQIVVLLSPKDYYSFRFIVKKRILSFSCQYTLLISLIKVQYVTHIYKDSFETF